MKIVYTYARIKNSIKSNSVEHRVNHIVDENKLTHAICGFNHDISTNIIGTFDGNIKEVTCKKCLKKFTEIN